MKYLSIFEPQIEIHYAYKKNAFSDNLMASGGGNTPSLRSVYIFLEPDYNFPKIWLTIWPMSPKNLTIFDPKSEIIALLVNLPFYRTQTSAIWGSLSGKN